MPKPKKLRLKAIQKPKLDIGPLLLQEFFQVLKNLVPTVQSIKLSTNYC